MKKNKILIGIQNTGKLSIGNYLGCLKKGLKYQEEGHDVIFMLANYHSLTTNNSTDITEKELIRLGCKNIVHQNPLHTELFFKLCCLMNLGSLLKMPQYKDKKDSVKYDLGLLLYPVLMAADIIINDPDIVIIGRDQLAHLELCNDIAKRYNGKYYDYEFGDFDKIMSLKDPTKKMSKSLGEKHVLYLFDEDYRAKMRSANMDEVAIQNVFNIAIGLELDPSIYGSNLELKMAIAERMGVIFA